MVAYTGSLALCTNFLFLVGRSSMRHVSSFAFILCLFPSLSVSPADEVKLSNGSTLSCTALQENEGAVAILYGDGVIRLERSQVVSASKNSPPSISKADSTATKILPYADIIRLLARQTWAVDLHAIPAIVVDVGTLKHVPYKSHRVAADCELNVYGDPTHPVCVEVGLLGRFLDHNTAKQRCVEFVASLFDDETSKAIILAMKRDKDLI